MVKFFKLIGDIITGILFAIVLLVFWPVIMIVTIYEEYIYKRITRSVGYSGEHIKEAVQGAKFVFILLSVVLETAWVVFVLNLLMIGGS